VWLEADDAAGVLPRAWAERGAGALGAALRRHTLAFDDQVAWLAVHTSKTAVGN
jgi:hypothetical protein